MSRINSHTFDGDRKLSRGSSTRPPGFALTGRMPDHIRGGVVKRKEYSRASGSRPFSTRAATTTMLAKRHYDETPRSVPRAGSVMDGLDNLPTLGQSTVLPRNSLPQPPSLQSTRFPPLQSPTPPQIQPAIAAAVRGKHLPPQPRPPRGFFSTESPRPIIQANVISQRSIMVAQSAELERQSALKLEQEQREEQQQQLAAQQAHAAVQGLEANEGNAMALVFKKMKGKAWKSSENPVLVVSSTISKDNTAGEEVRRAKLFYEYGRKIQSKKSTFDYMPPQSLPHQERLDFEPPLTFDAQQSKNIQLLAASPIVATNRQADSPVIPPTSADWHGIAKHMTTKTHIMVKNYYQRQVDSGKKKEWEDIAKKADKEKERGQPRSPAPQPTILAKR